MPSIIWHNKDDYMKKNFNMIDIVKYLCAILAAMGHVPPFGIQDSENIYYTLNFWMQNYFDRVTVSFFSFVVAFFCFEK